jgi:hypothetical protein
MKESFNYDDLFPERWLHAEDLQGRTAILTISDAYREDLRLPGGGMNPCGVLSFRGKKKEYVLNRSNAMVLVGLWGKQSSDWIGHRITIEAVPDDSGKSASGMKILFVGSPDISENMRVAQPGGKFRTIRATQAGSSQDARKPAQDAPERDVGSDKGADGFDFGNGAGGE